MNDNQTLKGFWWNPSNPEKKWYGVLKRTTKRIELECPIQNSASELIKDGQSSTLHGLDARKRPVTLLFANASGSPEGDHSTILYYIAYALIGIHVPSKESFRARRTTVRLQNLDGWLGLTGFNRRLKGRIDADRTFDVHIEYCRPEEQMHTVQQGLEIAFGINAKYSASLQAHSISENAYISVSGVSGFLLDEAWDLIGTLRLMLHVASLRPVHIVTWDLEQCFNSSDKSMLGACATVWSRNEREYCSIAEWDPRWVFRYPQVSNEFGAFFNRWLNLHNKYDEAIGCYNTTVYHSLPETVRHLCLTQALDAYHGICFNSHHNRDFKFKLAELIEHRKAVLEGLECLQDDFPDRVTKTRNYYTHHNPKYLEGGQVAKGVELIRMDEQLKILFQACVINNIGLPDECCKPLRCQIAKEIIEY